MSSAHVCFEEPSNSVLVVADVSPLLASSHPQASPDEISIQPNTPFSVEVLPLRAPTPHPVCQGQMQSAEDANMTRVLSAMPGPNPSSVLPSVPDPLQSLASDHPEGGKSFLPVPIQLSPDVSFPGDTTPLAASESELCRYGQKAPQITLPSHWQPATDGPELRAVWHAAMAAAGRAPMAASCALPLSTPMPAAMNDILYL